MVVVIVIGMPFYFWRRLSEWRFPFNRLYVVREDGQEGPAKKAKFVLGKLVVFNTANWFMPCLDMFFKLLLAGGMGVFFQRNQILGACGCWLICGAVAAFFAVRKPYAYRTGNFLSIISYVALMGSYAEAITDKLHADGHIIYILGFDWIVYFLWFLPYCFATADLFRLFDYAHRLWAYGLAFVRRSRSRRRGHSTADNGNDALENRALKAIATNHHQTSRRRHIFDILSSVLRIATRDGAVRTYGESAGGAAAVAAFKEQVCELIEVSLRLYTMVTLHYLCLRKPIYKRETLSESKRPEGRRAERLYGTVLRTHN